MKFSILMIVILSAACNQVQPVESAETDDAVCVDNWDVAYDAGSADERALRKIEQAQYEGLLTRSIDAQDALTLFDLTQACDKELIADWICTAYFSGNL